MRPSRASEAPRVERLAPSLSPRAGGIAEGGLRAGEGFHARERMPRRRLAAIALLVAALALPPALAFALWATAPTATELEQRWRRAAGFDPLAGFPAREASSSALRIEEIVRPLGLELAPQGAQRRPRVLPRMDADLAPLGKSAREVVRALRSPAPALRQLPPAVTSGLDGVRPQLLAVRETLLVEPPPRWERELGARWSPLAPDLLGHQRLHRLLVLAAYESALAGAESEVAAWLEAAWRFRGSLAGEPYLLPQLVGGAELQDELALLRALPAPPEDWRARLAALRVRPAVHRALRVEAWLAVQSLHRGSPLARSAEPPEGYVLRRVLGPLWWARGRHGVGHMVDGVEHAIARAEREGAAALAGDFVAEERARVPRWSSVGRALLDNLLEAPVYAARADLGVELTRQALELAGRRARGEPPARATVGSAVPGLAWEQEPENGRVVVRPTRDLPATGPHPLPLRAELPWPARSAPR